MAANWLDYLKASLTIVLFFCSIKHKTGDLSLSNSLMFGSALGFSKYVEEKWKSYNIQGWGGFILKEKLKLLKHDIKKWSLQTFGELNHKIEQEKMVVDQLDRLQEEHDLEDSEVSKLRESKSSVWQLMKLKESYPFQKARVQWIKEGDANTKFFHRCINNRNKVNGTEGLLINNEWTDDVHKVKSEIHKHFKLQFSRGNWARPTFNDLEFRRVNNQDNDCLTAPFSEDEVKNAIWDCGGNKSPGPDGFTFCFIKKMWLILKPEIMKFLEDFSSLRKDCERWQHKFRYLNSKEREFTHFK